MTGSHPQGQGNNNGAKSSLLGTTRQELHQGKMTLDQLERLDAMRHHEGNVERDRQAIGFVLNGGLHTPRISIEKQLQWKKLVPMVVLGLVVICAAFFLSGFAGIVWEAIKPEPTPITVLMPDPLNPSGYVTAQYFPPTNTPEPTQAATSMAPATVAPTFVLLPATSVPTEQMTYVVMKFTVSPDGSIALVDGRFGEGSLDGYQKVGDTQSCTLTNMPNFSVPAGYSEGLIYFEGVDKYQRPSGATIVGNTISFNLCTPINTNFSLYMK